MQYGTTQYAYNESGLRIKKSGTGVNVNYSLDGSMIIQSMDTINSKIIDYHLDQNEQVIGFRFDGKEFIYQRNIFGEIYGIIDISGNQFVKYEYTAFGVPTISLGIGLTTNETTIAQSINEQNIYLYKGYVYDQETGLYYYQTRYYNPEIGRWISIDTISYLDPESINGLNLYAYCGNNPVMFIDSTGYLSKFEVIGGIFLGLAIVVFATAVIFSGGTALIAISGIAAASGGGLLTSTLGGTINAFINEVENGKRENRLFNSTDFAYESIFYSSLNYVTRFTPNLGQKEILKGFVKSFVSDAFGFTVSDSLLKDGITYTIDFVRETIHGIKEGYIY